MPHINAARRDYFNPRSPHRERLKQRPGAARLSEFQSTLPAQGATLTNWARTPMPSISIHAPAQGATD